ncbi:(2Fe-2S)-binding protein [Achromobacter aloeverae]|uniref:Bacterioferritin-associated ferredoxin n=1 Tax=Achromobacter aloeverae TaxID=1750518 RepID=A0A4Q1HJI6_9BURK|nr:(2Fe-2S)-binding protein [Achromobacter aloeverae]RXN90141.1 bacterioferritin [Achromobacter aloeverae]
MYICVCNAITERQVRSCVDAGATTLDDLEFELGVASCCGSCAATAAEYLPGGRCSSVCQVQSVAVPTRARGLSDTVPLAEQGGQAANSFPIPVVAAA